MSRDAPLIFVVAGEPSGDVLGADLIAGIRAVYGNAVRFQGVGGPLMHAGGLDSLFDYADLSVMGLAEIVPALPRLRRRLLQTVEVAREQKPDLVITIDAPDFSFRVAKRLKDEGVPLVHYVAPSVWAWRAGRARKIAALYDHLLCLLPFEPPYFEAEGLKASFVGHPATSVAAGDGAAFRARYGLAGDARLLALLPGSRKGEVSRLFNLFSDAVKALPEKPDRVAIPVAPNVRSMVEAMNEASGLNAVLIHDPAQKQDLFAASDAALAASGTVALELAVAGVPTVIGYRMNPVSVAIARRLIKTRYVSLPNILAGREIMPELLQENCTVPKLAAALAPLLLASPQREAMREDLRNTAAMLRPPGGTTGKAAARAALSALEKKKKGGA